MGVRVGLLVLFLLGTTWACAARELVVSEKGDHKDNVCTLCEDYVNLAVDYLAENKTQTDIIDALHISCAKIPSIKQKCITLVDYYTTLFFSEISKIKPEDFCGKVNLCEKITAFASDVRENSCEMCHRTASELLIKLKDPDTQVEILEMLLKACKSMNNYEKKCKRMVFEYAPLILANAEQFLKSNDVCTILRACPATEPNIESVIVDVLELAVS